MSTRDPSDRFGVLRLSRDVGLRSNVGLIATDRQGGPPPGGSPIGQTVGLDATLAKGEHLTAHSFFIRSKSQRPPASETSGHAGYAEIKYSDPGLRLYLHHLRIDEAFDPTLGFVSQTNLFETQGYADFRVQPLSGSVREYGLKAEMTTQTDTDRSFLYQSNYFRGLASLRSGEFFLFSVDPQIERLPSDFQIRPGIVIPADTYRVVEYNLFLFSDTNAPTSGTVIIKNGGFYGGRKTGIKLDVTTAPTEGLKFGTGLDLDFVDLPQGEFVGEIIKADVAWSLSPSTLFLGLLQWDREDQSLGANLRFRWEVRRGSRFYFIVNPTHQKNGDAYLMLVKSTWLLD